MCLKGIALRMVLKLCIEGVYMVLLWLEVMEYNNITQRDKKGKNKGVWCGLPKLIKIYHWQENLLVLFCSGNLLLLTKKRTNPVASKQDCNGSTKKSSPEGPNKEEHFDSIKHIRPLIHWRHGRLSFGLKVSGFDIYLLQVYNIQQIQLCVKVDFRLKVKPFCLREYFAKPGHLGSIKNNLKWKICNVWQKYFSLPLISCDQYSLPKLPQDAFTAIRREGADPTLDDFFILIFTVV